MPETPSSLHVDTDERISALALMPVSHPGIDVRLAYATLDNFAGEIFYDRADALLQPDALAALCRAAEKAQALGLRIGLLDAWRPAAVQERFWAIRPDPMYVADPAIGSDHTRGVAVDVTLIDANGDVLDMGSAFDEASERSHHGYDGLTPPVEANRSLLLDFMEGAGFCRNAYEWWHYSLPMAADYPLIPVAPSPDSHS